MVETLPAFVAVFIAVGLLRTDAGETISMWAQVFFISRIVHAVVYTLDLPYLRTPIYLVSWFAILAIGYQLVV